MNHQEANMPAADARERIRQMYPGDAQKSLRNQLYSIPDFLKSDPSAEAIQTAAHNLGAPAPEQSATVLPAEVPPDPPATSPEQVIQALVSIASGQEVVIATVEQYAAADSQFARINKALKDLETQRLSFTAPLNASLKAINATFKAPKEMLEAERDRYGVAMAEFQRQQLEVRRAAEKEAARVQEQATAEARRQAEAAQQALIEARQSVATEEDPFLAALRAEDVQEAAQAALDAVRNAVVTRNAVVLPPVPEKVTAAGSRTTVAWTWEIVDESRVDREHCSPDSKKLNLLVEGLKLTTGGDISKVNPELYPGLKISEILRVSGR
jgi:hypothetical protein